jgi:hypothetical protein
MKKVFVLFGVAILVITAIGLSRVVPIAVDGSPPAPKPNSATIRAQPAPTPPCGPGLAAQDLAGNCRARPNPTPGALEAVSAPRQATAKTPASTNPKPPN